MLKKGEKEYYYLYNSQNDVIGLIDSDGKQVVNYSYDAWGKQTGLTDISGERFDCFFYFAGIIIFGNYTCYFFFY